MTKKSIISLLLLLLFLCHGFVAYAQQYFFKSYGVREGLPSSEVYDIIQASDNSIWLTTFRGVSHFDGKQFTNYTKEQGLNSNLPRTVFEDSQGRIWVGFWSDGLNYIKDGKVYSFQDELLKTYKRVIQFFETNDGSILIFNTYSILRYKDGNFELLHRSEKMEDYNKPNDVVQMPDGTIWVATMGSGLAKINPEPFSMELLNSKNSTINDITFSVLVNKEGNLLVGSYGVLYEYNNGKFVEHRLPGAIDTNRVRDIYQDADSNYWLALYGNGVMVLDENFQLLHHFNEETGIPDMYFHKLLRDVEGNTWLASFNNGLIRFKDKSFVTYTNNHGLLSNLINDVISFRDHVYIATDKGVVHRRNDTIVTRYLENQFVYQLTKLPDGAIWYTSNLGYGELGGTHFMNEEDTYYSIASNEEGGILLAGNFYLRTIQNELQKTYRFINLVGRTVEAVDNEYIIGNNDGIFWFANDSLQKLENLPPDLRAVQSSSKLSDTEVFFGNTDYLIYLKKERDSFYSKVFPRRKFQNLKGFNALVAQGNTLWAAATNGLAVIDVSALLENDSVALKMYDRNLGFSTSEPTDNSLEVTENGDVYIGTSEGFQVFSENQLNTTDVAPTLTIDAVKLFSETFEDSLYRKESGYVFPYRENHLTFQLSANTFTYPENSKFSYLMEGLPDATWSKPSKDPKAVFPFLPPGSYTFNFKADNGFGVWEHSPKKLSFVIEAPFWKTETFRWSVFIGLGLILVGSVYFYNKMKRNKQQKYLQGLLIAQEEERRRISKELHDGVGQNLLLIKNSSLLDTTKVPDLVDKTIEDIRQLSRNLHPVELEKFGLTKALSAMLSHLEEVTPIFMTEEIEDIDNVISKEKEIHIYRMVQECLNNVLKHAKATALRVEVHKKNDGVHIQIQDNGKGFNLQQKKATSKSLGLQSLYERVIFLKGNLEIDSKISKGTRVSIQIPSV